MALLGLLHAAGRQRQQFVHDGIFRRVDQGTAVMREPHRASVLRVADGKPRCSPLRPATLPRVRERRYGSPGAKGRACTMTFRRPDSSEALYQIVTPATGAPRAFCRGIRAARNLRLQNPWTIDKPVCNVAQRIVLRLGAYPNCVTLTI